MKRNILFSLIVGTYDRLPQLKMLLESLTKIQKQNFEVIIVDQNDNDAVESLIQPFMEMFPVSVLKQRDQNASKARNLGAARAKGDWIAFPDDDCCYDSSTLDMAEKKILETNPDLVSGIVLDFQGHPLYFSKLPEDCRVNHRNISGKHSEPALFVRKSLFQQLGGFNENYGPGTPNFAAEGLDFCSRAIENGKYIQFTTSIRIYHPRKFPPFNKQAQITSYRYAYGNTLVTSRFNRRGVYLSLSKALFLLPIKYVVFKKERYLMGAYTIKGTIDGLRKSRG